MIYYNACIIRQSIEFAKPEAIFSRVNTSERIVIKCLG